MKFAKPLDKVGGLPGSVVKQFRVVGGKRYGPYWSRMWREGGTLRAEYVPAVKVEAVRAACERHSQKVNANRTALYESRALIGECKRMFKELTRTGVEGI